MASELTTCTWVVTYTDYASASGKGSIPNIIEIDAAYYAPTGHLIEFKDTDHQVVFAIHSGIVTTIIRNSAKQQAVGA